MIWLGHLVRESPRWSQSWALAASCPPFACRVRYRADVGVGTSASTFMCRHNVALETPTTRAMSAKVVPPGVVQVLGCFSFGRGEGRFPSAHAPPEPEEERVEHHGQ
jgi:hypothetical protein